tara:strand:+ start:125 stop:643 length:519 start_codon:yes stop_codon:yes gene_type:complete
MTQYYSNTKEDYVNINDMHHQHVWYAFKKLCDRLEELGICEHIWEDDYALWNQHKFVRKDVYELLFDKCERLEKLRRKQDVKILSMYGYGQQNHVGHRYVFSEIPNDKDGKEFINLLRCYLNDKSYKMRVRGQYLDKSKLGKDETWKDYDDGQPLSKSKCVRVYLDQKRESE